MGQNHGGSPDQNQTTDSFGLVISPFVRKVSARGYLQLAINFILQGDAQGKESETFVKNQQWVNNTRVLA